MFSSGLFADIIPFGSSCEGPDETEYVIRSQYDKALGRARRQLKECIIARGENNRSECQAEYDSLITSINYEQSRHDHFNQQRNSSAESKYQQALQRIESQYRECVASRRVMRSFECQSDRSRLIDNAKKERDDALVHEFYEDHILSDLFHEEGYYQAQADEKYLRSIRRNASIAIVSTGVVGIVYYLFSSR